MIEEFKDLKEVQMIIFQLGKEEYAIPIMNVQEIITLQIPTKLPKSPAFVEGVINLRGKIIPIVDGRKKFQLEANNKSDESKIMVLDVDKEIIGLIVDAVSEVLHLKTEDIEPPPIDSDADFLWGVGKFKNRLLILLNPEKFLTDIETRDIKKLVNNNEPLKQPDELLEAELASK